MKTTPRLRIFFWVILNCGLLYLLLFPAIDRTASLANIPESPQLFYNPHYNIFVPGNLGGINIYRYLYALTVCVALVLFVLRREGRETKNFSEAHKIFFSAAIIVFIAALCGQTREQMLALQDEIRFIQGKNLQEKYSALFKETYAFALESRRLLPGNHSGQLMTDLDMTRDPGMAEHRRLSYFLYPIDIRGVRGEKTDVLVIYKKKAARQAVPEDYQVIGNFPPDYALAVKRGDQP